MARKTYTMTTMKTQAHASPHPASAARRLAKMQRKVAQWWDSMPVISRRSHFLGAQIATAIGVSATSLGPALRSLGWRREQVRLGGVQVGVWLAPGTPALKRPRGRPSFHDQLSQPETTS